MIILKKDGVKQVIRDSVKEAYYKKLIDGNKLPRASYKKIKAKK